MTQVFVRDDDVGFWTPALDAMLHFFCERAIPVAYQVVPRLLSEETGQKLAALRDRHPGLIELHQHGNEHRQQLGGEQHWSEFAGGRPYAEQAAAIEQGRDVLRRVLGPHLDPSVFTPPAHKYDAATLDALEALDFRVLSAGVQSGLAARAYYAVGRALGRVELLGRCVSYHGRALPGRRLCELSTGVNVDEDTDASGKRIEKDAERLLAEFAACRARGATVGIMLHHETYSDAARFEPLAGFIDTLRADESVRFASLSSLAADL